jgi:hypothetical protein
VPKVARFLMASPRPLYPAASPWSSNSGSPSLVLKRWWPTFLTNNEQSWEGCQVQSSSSAGKVFVILPRCHCQPGGACPLNFESPRCNLYGSGWCISWFLGIIAKKKFPTLVHVHHVESPRCNLYGSGAASAMIWYENLALKNFFTVEISLIPL